MKPLELIEQGRFLGEEFLIWLWLRGTEEGGTSGLSGDTSCCFVDDAVVLVSERGDVKELALRKGNPAESREAFEALSRGMKPSRAKLRLLAGDLEWVFTMDAATLVQGAMKLPPTQSKDPAGRVADRLFLLEECTTLLEARFARFLAEKAADPAALAARFQDWIRQNLAGSAGDVPWEA